MSNIYIQEPPTNGKVLLKTTVGELEIELFSKEAPKTCRNFIQLCMDGFYDNTLFHRLVSNFIVQAGENIEEPKLIEPVKNEFHSRLRFTRRGLVGLAAKEQGRCSMEFFFTLEAAPELQNKHTIFGKVTGETVYNLLKLNDSQTDANERPLYPHKINKIKILNNPFDDIVPRVDLKKKSKGVDTKKPKDRGVKNFKLISFGDEAEQDEQETRTPKNTEASGSSNSSRRDVQSAVKIVTEKDSPKAKTLIPKEEEDSDSDFDQEKEKLSQLEQKRKEIQDQIRDIKKQYHKDRTAKIQTNEVKEAPVSAGKGDAMKDFYDEKEKYKKKKLISKGSSREDFTLSLLEKFKNKLYSAQESKDQNALQESKKESDGENWLSHKLDFTESQDAVMAKDASKKEDDWYDIFDPRNPLNKRKRGAEKTPIDELNKKRK